MRHFYILLVFICLVQYGCSKTSQEDTASSLNTANIAISKYVANKTKKFEFIELDPIFVNLPSTQNKGGEQYVNVVILLKTDDTSFEKDIEFNKHLIRDKVNSTLSIRNASDLKDVSSRESVAREVTLVLNSIFEPQLVQAMITYQKENFIDLEYILKLQKNGVLPEDLPADKELSHESVELIKNINESDLPIKGVIFKEFRMNMNR